MTHDEIRDMEAGRDLDALIAEKFFGWEWKKRVPFDSKEELTALIGPDNKNEEWKSSDDKAERFSDWDSIWCEGVLGFPTYSTEIEIAWRIDGDDWQWDFEEKGRWLIVHIFLTGVIASVFEAWSKTKAETYAVARCKAALIAITEDE